MRGYVKHIWCILLVLALLCIPACSDGDGFTAVVVAYDTPAHIITQTNYVCNGVTDDVEIQAAITAASTTGGSVVLMPGNYYPIASINMADGVTVEGKGDSVVMILSSNILLFDFGTTDHATLRNITIDGDSQAYGGAGFGMVVGSAAVGGGIISRTGNEAVNATNVTNATNATVEDMIFFELAEGISDFQTVITFQHSNKVSIRNNKIYGCTKGYIRICQSDNSAVTGNVIVNSGAYGGIGICCPRNVVCSQNIIIGTGRSEARGAIWVGAYYRDSYNCKITDNIIINEFTAGRSGITIIGGGAYPWNVDNIEISGNTIHDILDAPCIGNAEMAGATGNWSWTNVRITDNTLSNGGYGIQMGDIGNCYLEVYVADNDISNASIAPVLFDSSVDSTVEGIQ